MAITRKQEKFAQEYIKDFNGTQAYLRAFPDADYKTAGTVANRWLKDDELTDYIQTLVDKYVEVTVNPNRIILELMEIAFDREKPLGERNKALAQLCKIYNLENINVNAKVESSNETVIKITIDNDDSIEDDEDDDD